MHDVALPMARCLAMLPVTWRLMRDPPAGAETVTARCAVTEDGDEVDRLSPAFAK